MPYGVIGFYGEALIIQNVSESDIVTVVTLPIARTGGNLGAVQVFLHLLPFEYFK